MRPFLPSHLCLLYHHQCQEPSKGELLGPQKWERFLGLSTWSQGYILGTRPHPHMQLTLTQTWACFPQVFGHWTFGTLVFTVMVFTVTLKVRLNSASQLCPGWAPSLRPRSRQPT